VGAQKNQRRVAPRWRQQLNDAFADPRGHIAISKTIAVLAQFVVLAHIAVRFGDLIERWEALLVCLTFLIAPDAIKKLINLKYGSGSSR
jgi:hypothetical protein